jgi:hypothetical protein
LIKIDLKEQYKKPIAEGGSSLVYCAKMIVTFANHESRAHNNHKNKIEKV